MMTIQDDRNDDHGDADKGNEKTALWARMQELGTTEAGNNQPESANPVVFIVGIAAIVGLAILCFQLAFSGARQGKMSKPVAGVDYRQGQSTFEGPGAPARTAAPTVTSAPAYQPQPVSTPVPLSSPSLVLPSPSSLSTTWASASERDQVAALLGDCRIAYDLSGELSQRWMTAVAATSSENVSPVNTLAVSKVATDTKAGPRPLTNEDWNAIDSQIDAIAGTIGIATQPSRYPAAMQDTSMDLGREMRTFLQTTRAALSETDPGLRAELQTRANTHRSKAGELLTRLESSLKEEVARTAPY